MLIAYYSVEVTEGVYRDIYISTAHFESISGHQSTIRRSYQFGAVFKILKNKPFSVVAGDYNEDNLRREGLNLKNNAFECVVRKNFLKTPDYRKAMYTMPKTKKNQPWRPDKVVISIKRENEGYQMEAIAIKRLGDFVIAPY